jgi:tellurite resistance protein TehA-like permease
MIRMLPMSVTGVFCNVVGKPSSTCRTRASSLYYVLTCVGSAFAVALAVAHIQGIILVALGCIMTGLAPLLFALIKVNASYWAFGFPSAILSVVGADL